MDFRGQDCRILMRVNHSIKTNRRIDRNPGNTTAKTQKCQEKALYRDFNTDRRKHKWRNTVVLNKCKR